jgi:hypothetical protein
MTPTHDDEFWQNFQYQRRIGHRIFRREKLNFPYRLRARTPPQHTRETTEHQSQNAETSTMDLHENQPLGITMVVKNGCNHNVEDSLEPNSCTESWATGDEDEGEEYGAEVYRNYLRGADILHPVDRSGYCIICPHTLFGWAALEYPGAIEELPGIQTLPTPGGCQSVHIWDSLPTLRPATYPSNSCFTSSPQSARRSSVGDTEPITRQRPGEDFEIEVLDRKLKELDLANLHARYGSS